MNLVHAVLAAAFIALILVALGYELRTLAHARRHVDDPARVARFARRTRRRLLGLFFLALAVALLVNSPAFEARVPSLPLRLAWIGMAFVSVLLAVLLAVRDLSDTGRLAQEEATRVVVESLARLQIEIDRIKREKSEHGAGEAPGKTERPAQNSTAPPPEASHRHPPPDRRDD